MVALDHSQIYRRLTVRNIGHIWRALNIRRTVDRLQLPPRISYCDVGCSNGYLTAEVARRLVSPVVIGFDHNVQNLAVARERYPGIEFRAIDLNQPGGVWRVADFLTCFETIEHVGSIPAALENIRSMMKPDGILLMTVPIESGFIGAIKYLIKRHVFGYELTELSEDPNVWRAYERALLRGRDVSGFRGERPGWGTHFGFDYRPFEVQVRRQFSDVRAWTAGTSRFICAKGAL